MPFPFYGRSRKNEKEAVALGYEPSQAAPTVLASGRGKAAEKILTQAEALGIPIHDDPNLAHTLNMLQVGSEIPPELYQVVAQVLIYVRDADELNARVKPYMEKDA